MPSWCGDFSADILLLDEQLTVGFDGESGYTKSNDELETK